MAGDGAAVVDIAGAGEVQVAFCVQRAAVVDAGGVDAGRRCAADRALVLQFAIGADDHFTGHGPDLPGVAHADTRFSAHQHYLPGVHAAQLRYVYGHGGLVAISPGLRRGLGVVGVDLVASGGHLQIVRPDARIDLHCASNQVGVVGVAGIKAFALNSDRTSVHGVTGDGAVFQLRLAGGQGRAVGVDEAAAVAGNPGRVGDHHLGTLPRDFDVALQLAGVAGVDFVEDDPRVAFGHRGVALDPATQLRLAVSIAVIEDHATFIDIELVVSVARHPGSTRCLNIHLRRTVGAFDHRRTLTCCGRRVRHNGARRPCRYYAQGHQPDRSHQRKTQRP